MGRNKGKNKGGRSSQGGRRKSDGNFNTPDDDLFDDASQIQGNNSNRGRNSGSVRGRGRGRGRGSNSGGYGLRDLNADMNAFHIGSSSSSKNTGRKSKPTAQNSKNWKSKGKSNWQDSHIGLGFGAQQKRPRHRGLGFAESANLANDQFNSNPRFNDSDANEVIFEDSLMGWKLTKILIQYKMTFVKGGYMHEKYSERTVVAVDSKGVENTESSDADENALVEQSMDELEVLPFEIHPVQFIEGEDDVSESEEEETLSDVDDIEISTRSEQSADERSDESVEKDASVDKKETTQDDSHPIEIEDSNSQASNLPEPADSFCPNSEEEGYIAAPILEADINSSPSDEVEHPEDSDELLFVIDKTPTVDSSAEVATEDTRTALGEPVHVDDDDDDQWTDDSGETEEDATMADFDLQNYDNEPLNPIFSGVVPTVDTSISTSSKKTKKRRTRRGGARVQKQKEKENEDERREELEIMIDYLRNVNGAGDTALPGNLDQLALDELLSMGLDVNLQQKELSSFASHDLELDESDESDSELDDSDEYSESDGSGENDLEHGLLEELSDSDSDLEEGDLDSDDSAYIESLKQGQNDIFESDEEAQYLIDSAFPEEGRWNENGQAPGRRKAEAKMKRIMQGSFEEDDSSEEDGEESAQNQPMSKSAKRKIDRKLKKQERHARKAARKDQERMVYGISKDESWGKKSKKKRMKSGGVIIDFGSIHKLIKDFVKDVDGYHSLPLPPLPSTARRAVTRLAGCYNLKTKSKGSGKSKMAVLIRTSRTAYPDVDDYQSWNKIDAIVSETDKKIGISNKTYNDVNARKKGKGRSTGEGGGRNTLSHGTVVGHRAPPISQDNIGHRLLLNMGWTPGQSLGTGHGITVPLEAVIRGKRRGLGT